METTQTQKPKAKDIIANVMSASGVSLSLFHISDKQQPSDFNELVRPHEQFTVNDAVSRHLRMRMSLDEQFQMYKGLFVFFASNLNDVSACEAFSVLLKIIEEAGRWRYGHIIDKEEKDRLDSKKRELEEELFYFLDEVFWCLPLYTPNEYEEKTNCTSSFVRENRLQKTKSAVWCFVSGIFSSYVYTYESISPWNKIDDKQLESEKTLAIKALEFLCNSYDESKFKIKAKDLIEEDESFRKRNGYHGCVFSIPKEDKDNVLERVKRITPDRKLETITHCLLVFGEKMHPDFKKLFYHAHVRNGGEILLSTKN